MHIDLSMLYMYVNVYFIKYVLSDSCTDLNNHISSSGVSYKTLLGFVYFESTDFGNILSCGIRCLKQRKCKSINFNKETLLCQLNTENHISKSSSLNVSYSGFQYYNTQEWSQDFLGQCANHNCPEEHVCEPSTVTSSYTCTQCVAEDGCKNCLPPFIMLNSTGTVYSPVGCYRSRTTNALPILQANLRSQINWYNLQATVDNCALLSHQAGYVYFGIEFYGECYVGNQLNVGDDKLVKALNCESKACDKGYGAADIMFVYKHR